MNILYMLFAYFISSLTVHYHFSLCRKWSMVVKSGAGCVSTLLETCKTVLLPDSAVNSLACAKPQEWQVPLKCFLHIADVIFSLVLAVHNCDSILSIIGLCYGTCPSGYIRASRSGGACSESSVPWRDDHTWTAAQGARVAYWNTSWQQWLTLWFVNFQSYCFMYC
jgi:hypothetical protein